MELNKTDDVDNHRPAYSGPRAKTLLYNEQNLRFHKNVGSRGYRAKSRKRKCVTTIEELPRNGKNIV